MLRLELERRRGRFTQASLGRESGLNPTTISAIENGRLNPTDSELQRLAEVLGVGDPATLAEEVPVS